MPSTGFLGKPFTLDQLEAKVKELLDAHGYASVALHDLVI
jgi:hypothetical protein